MNIRAKAEARHYGFTIHNSSNFAKACQSSIFDYQITIQIAIIFHQKPHPIQPNAKQQLLLGYSHQVLLDLIVPLSAIRSLLFNFNHLMMYLLFSHLIELMPIIVDELLEPQWHHCFYFSPTNQVSSYWIKIPYSCIIQIILI